MMIAAVVVAGGVLGFPRVAHAQAMGTQLEQRSNSNGPGMPSRQFDQMMSPFEGDDRQVVTQTPAVRVDPRAQEQGTGGSGMVQSDTLETRGIIRSVSDQGMTLTESKKDRIVTLRADGQMQPMRDGSPLALSSLKVGDEVRASYQFDEQGQKVLRGLEVIKDGASHSKKK
ncbi:MAG: hypothetical protein ABW123_09555 [Cystobacter sp.]